MQIHRGWLVCAVALGLGAAACGGKKDDKKPDDKGGTGKVDDGKGGGGGGDQKSGVANGKIVGQTGDDIALLPIDADLVAGANLQQVQQGGLWKDFVMPLLAKNMGKMEEFKEKCGFDPLTTVKSASFSVKGFEISGGAIPDIVAVVHGIDKKQGMKCLDAIKEDAAKKNGPTFTTDGDVVILAKDGKSFAVTWIADSTMLVAGPSGSKDQLAKLAKGDDTLRTSPQFVDMYSKLDVSESAWFLLKGNAKIVDQLSAIGLKPIAIFGTVNATDALSADVHLRTNDATEAKKAQDTLNALAAQAKNFAPIDKIGATLDGNDVRVQAMMTGAHLRQMQETLRGSRGGGAAPAPEAPAAPAAPATP